MEQDRLFKVLIAINWLLQLLLYLLPISSWYSNPMFGRLIVLDGYGAIFNLSNSILYQFPLWGFFIASIGMLFFWNWARYLYLMLWFYGWWATLIFGVRVALPVESFIGVPIATVDGIILYLAFASALRHKFKKTSG